MVLCPIFVTGRRSLSRFLFNSLSDAHRYHFTANKLEKIAEINVMRSEINREIFVSELETAYEKIYVKFAYHDNETTGQCLLMITATLNMPDGFSKGCVAALMCVGGKMHALVHYFVESCCP